MITILLTKIIALLTSIAQKDYITTDITDDITVNDEYITTDNPSEPIEYTVLKDGNFIVMTFATFRTKKAITNTDEIMLLSGLPKPKSNTNMTCLFYYGGNVFRMKITPDGELKTWDVAISNGTNLVGTIVYILDRGVTV